MNMDFTRIAVVLDRSGSMESITDATIAGFNEFVVTQRQLPGKVLLKLVQFDDQLETVWDKPLADAPLLDRTTFVPRGSTALLDAQGHTIATLGQELAAMPEHERPAKVIVLTLTDGFENASSTYTAAAVAAMIREQRERYSWDFLFLGANQDAIAMAASMNIPAGSALTFAARPENVRAAMSSMGRALFSRRVGGRGDFDDAEREAAIEDQA